MATHKSALKAHRQSLQHRLRNRIHRARMRTAVKRFRKALEAGETETARGLLPATLSIVDHSAKLRVIRDATAARTKSRLTRALNRAAR